MVSKETVKAAYDTLAAASQKVARESDKWIHFVAMCQALGWVLELDANHIDSTEQLLKYLRGFLGESTPVK